ncbi:MAG: PAS domain-containing protein [Desulfovibrio sp.]|jgi:PAS domain S-box-containing protein|nr:PAS domain-containing protein [Desulfovibrio sp.]
MAQDSTYKKHSRRSRAAYALLALLALIVAGVVTGANFFLDARREGIYRETEQGLSSRAASAVANLTVWSGRLKGQVEIFTSLDMLRLFAAEADNANIPAEELRRLAAEQKADSPSPSEENSSDGVSAGHGPGATERILPRLPVMLSQLKDFAAKNAYLNVGLLNRKMEAYISVSGATNLSKEQKGLLSPVVDNKTPVFLPARLQDGVLLMDMVFPVRAPLYLASDERVVAALLVTCDVTEIVRSVTRPGGEKGRFNSCVMQMHDKNLQIVAETAGESQLITLPPDWRLDADRGLPLGLRNMPDASGKEFQTYSIALPVPGLTWYAAEMIDAGRIEKDYADFRRNVIIIGVLLVALAAIILVAFWWWALGRRERAIADEMRHLYQLVNQQKQIMDGVNSALSAGIILNDLNGVIYYANQSYVQMTGLNQPDLTGLSYRNLTPDMARSLVTHTQAVYQSKKMASFTEVLPIKGVQRHFLTSCSPFCSESGVILGVVSVYNDIMDLVMAQRRAQHMITQTVAVFVRAIEAVDPYLCGQSSFTARLAVALAHHLDKNDDVTLVTLRTAASLSQIGMIQLPRELLTKSDKLNDEERALLKKHVEYARNALEGIEFGIPVLEAIVQMYERIDGSGYPAGLKDEQISLNAKILAVANTFCALMRPRSYRSALDTQQAINIFTAKPYKYDLKVVQALVDFLKSEQGGVFLKRLLSGELTDSTS